MDPIQHDFKQIIIETNSAGNITAIISKNPNVLYDQLSYMVEMNGDTENKIRNLNKNTKIIRAVITFNNNELIKNCADFLKRSDNYTGGAYYSEMFKWGFLDLNDHVLIMIEDINNPNNSLIGNLEDHVASTIKSICY